MKPSETYFFETPNLKLEYGVFGCGKKVVFCFHGFGRTLNDFKLLASKLDDYTVYSFHHIYHGKTLLKNKKSSIKKNELKKLIHSFLKEKKIISTDILGYSLGGRIALVIYELIEIKINNLILLAPDGIKSNLLYQAISKNQIGKSLYRKMVINPNFAKKAISYFQKYRIIDKHTAQFMKGNLDNRFTRFTVLKIWEYYNLLEPDHLQINKKIKENNTNVILCYGKKDKIIPIKGGENFAKKINQERNLLSLPYGHNLTKPEIFEEVVNQFKPLLK